MSDRDYRAVDRVTDDNTIAVRDDGTLIIRGRSWHRDGTNKERNLVSVQLTNETIVRLRDALSEIITEKGIQS